LRKRLKGKIGINLFFRNPLSKRNRDDFS